MDTLHITKLIQIYTLDGKYKNEIDDIIKTHNFIEFNTKFREEYELINMILKYNELNIPDILMYFDYTKYMHFPKFINRLAKVYYDCGIKSTMTQSNLPYPMYCFTRACDMIQRLLLTTDINDELRLQILDDHRETIKSVCQGYNYYQYEIPQRIEDGPRIVLTMTTCKRLELFIKTVQSFLVCCTDANMIYKWVCIDDNSVESDRLEMVKMFPWIDFIFKDESQKGHAKSMNILRKYVKTTYSPDYILHLEDDWKFITKYNFITHSLNILKNENVGQCLFNMNYIESEDIIITGGILKQTNNYYYLEHEYLMPYNPEKQCSYWPHFSMRPGLLRAEIWDEEFPESSNHFELEFAYKYITNGWITAFLPSITCIHTGKLTYETGSNAYELNNVTQFKHKEKLEIQYTYLESFDSYKKILNRLKRLRPKNWLCTIHKNSELITQYAKYIIDVPVLCLDWDIIFIVKDIGDEKTNILLNKTEYLETNNIIGFVVSTKNVELLLNVENFVDLSKINNIVICKSII